MEIALITASIRPIPATLGGATQTMMTHLIDVNEISGNHSFTIFNYYEPKAVECCKRYNHSHFHFYKGNKVADKLYSLFWRFLRKITNERVYVRDNFIKWVASIINQGSFDVVILEGNCFQVQQMRSLIKNKIILHMHIDRLNTELRAAKEMINVSDGIFAISEFCKDRMAEVDSSCRSKVFVVKNTIDTEKFVCQGDGVRDEIRNKYGIKLHQKVVMYCGRVDATKGVLELVRAIKKLDDENIHLLIIGSSVYKDSKKNEYIEMLERETASLKGGVTFTGYVPQSELPQIVSGVTVATVPSQCLEAAGNVTIEALSCGVPVIASTQGGIPEYADTSACRLIDVGPSFIDEFAEQIHEVCYNDELYKSLKSNARRVALQYDKHHYYNNFITSIEKVLAL